MGGAEFSPGGVEFRAGGEEDTFGGVVLMIGGDPMMSAAAGDSDPAIAASSTRSLASNLPIRVMARRHISPAGRITSGFVSAGVSNLYHTHACLTPAPPGTRALPKPLSVPMSKCIDFGPDDWAASPLGARSDSILQNSTEPDARVAYVQVCT